MQSSTAQNVDNRNCDLSKAPGQNGSLVYMLKEGEILRYKKRYFKSNWKQEHLTLYNNATFTLGKIAPANNQKPTKVTCQHDATLIIFGQQLKLVPKRPLPPSGYELEQMLAIGLINHLLNASGKFRVTQIIFYWFLSPSIQDLLDWISAFQKSLMLPKVKINKTEEDVAAAAAALNAFSLLNPAAFRQQSFSSAAAIPKKGFESNKLSTPVRRQQDELGMAVLMANAQDNINSMIPGFALAGAAGGLLAASHPLSEELFNGLSAGGGVYGNLNALAFANGGGGGGGLIGPASGIGDGGFSYDAGLGGLGALATCALPAAVDMAGFDMSAAIDCGGGDCGGDGGIDMSMAMCL